MQKIISFYHNEDGATAVEYALILLGIATVITASVEALGIRLTGIFTNIFDKFQTNP